jgi:L-lactate dehydrogenase complex protein LldF
MGSVLTPAYVGIEKTLDLPQAATLCGECHVVCPMKIPLPDLLRKLRERQFERGLRPWVSRDFPAPSGRTFRELYRERPRSERNT